jgi:hypothetical protein
VYLISGGYQGQVVMKQSKGKNILFLKEQEMKNKNYFADEKWGSKEY